MKRPQPPKMPSEIDKLLDRDAERKYGDAKSEYDDAKREYDRKRYGGLNTGPWGDGE